MSDSPLPSSSSQPDEAPVEQEVHEIGNRTYIVAPVEPLDVDGVRTLTIGTALWGLAFIALLPFYGRLSNAGHLWVLWTCAAGFGLGLYGWEYCRRKRRARVAAAEDVSITPR